MTLIERNEGARSTAQLNFILNEVKICRRSHSYGENFCEVQNEINELQPIEGSSQQVY